MSHQDSGGSACGFTRILTAAQLRKRLGLQHGTPVCMDALQEGRQTRRKITIAPHALSGGRRAGFDTFVGS